MKPWLLDTLLIATIWLLIYLSASSLSLFH